MDSSITTLGLRSIIGAHPRFYWNDDAIPGTEWLRTGDQERPTNIDKERIGGEDEQRRPTATETETVSEEATDDGINTEVAELPSTGDDSSGRTSKRVSNEKEGVWTAEDEADPYSSWLALPGKDNLGLSRHWHYWGGGDRMGCHGWSLCHLALRNGSLRSSSWKISRISEWGRAAGATTCSTTSPPVGTSDVNGRSETEQRREGPETVEITVSS